MSPSFLREERETHVLGLLRVAFATLLLVFTWQRARELLGGFYFGDVFHLPLWPGSFVPSRQAYGALLAVQALACLLALLGLLSRPALLLAASCGLYGFFCDRLQYHNNRYQLLLLTLLVALTPCDRSFLPFRPARPGPGPRWAVRLVAAQISLVYLASSLGKLLDPDWRTGVVMQLRFGLGHAHLPHFVPASWASILSERWFAHAASLGAISNELFLALGLWSRRTRVLALWLGLMFHLGIEIAANVELFSYTMLAGYLAFVTPEVRERQLSWGVQAPLGRALAALFRRADLLARFQHHEAAAQSELLLTTDRDGGRHRGLAAWRELARATPVLFPFWLPLRVLTWRPGPAR